jgi:uncharacterized surface anchored protein
MIALQTAENSINNNFGLIELSTIAGTIYYDQEDDNMLNNSNPGLSGQTVTLSGEDLNGNPVHVTTTTDANGAYSFTGLYAGDYEVTYTNNQPDYLVDSAQAGSTIGSLASNAVTIDTINLQAGEDSTVNNF